MKQQTLNNLILVAKSQALNTDRPIGEIIDMKHHISSDADPEVLLQIVFSAPVQLTEIRVAGEQVQQRPMVLKLQSGTLGFDQMAMCKNSFRLVYNAGVAQLKLPAQSVRQDTAFTVMLLDNQADDEQTLFDGIEFYGTARQALDTRGKTLNCKS